MQVRRLRTGRDAGQPGLKRAAIALRFLGLVYSAQALQEESHDQNLNYIRYNPETDLSDVRHASAEQRQPPLHVDPSSPLSLLLASRFPNNFSR